MAGRTSPTTTPLGPTLRTYASRPGCCVCVPPGGSTSRRTNDILWLVLIASACFCSLLLASVAELRSASGKIAIRSGFVGGTAFPLVSSLPGFLIRVFAMVCVCASRQRVFVSALCARSRVVQSSVCPRALCCCVSVSFFAPLSGAPFIVAGGSRTRNLSWP